MDDDLITRMAMAMATVMVEAGEPEWALLDESEQAGYMLMATDALKQVALPSKIMVQAGINAIEEYLPDDHDEAEEAVKFCIDQMVLAALQ